MLSRLMRLGILSYDCAVAVAQAGAAFATYADPEQVVVDGRRNDAAELDRLLRGLRQGFRARKRVHEIRTPNGSGS